MNNELQAQQPRKSGYRYKHTSRGAATTKERAPDTTYTIPTAAGGRFNDGIPDREPGTKEEDGPRMKELKAILGIVDDDT